MLRDAGVADLDQIRRWRNHPRVRAAYIHTAFISPEEHAAWWSRVSRDPARRVLVFEFDGAPYGVVMFTVEADRRSAEWGFFLDIEGLERRGALLPAWIAMEAEAIEYGFGVLGLEEIGGRTRATNRPVLELHRRFGFQQISERSYDTTIDGVPERIVWTALRRPQSEFELSSVGQPRP